MYCSQVWNLINLISLMSQLSYWFACHSSSYALWSKTIFLKRSCENGIITRMTTTPPNVAHLNYTSSNTSHLHLKPQHHNRDNDLEGTRPQCLKIANNEMSDEFSRGNILESLTVYFHKIHDFTLIVTGTRSSTQCQWLIVTTSLYHRSALHHRYTRTA